MLIYLVFVLTILILVSVVLLAGSLLSKKLVFDREKMSPFECGFSPKFNARLPFTLRFFLIAIIFLVFDVELILMFPFLTNFCSSNTYPLTFLIITFLVILLLGLIHEWNQGSLEWAS
uniref:NADH-ubiquinone oxidoreductase chain 3 n=1 Tax=Calanus hyperboreus TaxID=114069 RepID=K7QLF4_CALHY|nr:NADH dehydrogenase subunit 3 [Calanus hyperboreus]AFU88794.1 NADH dehydrogenase subunit 3 [Calanus hyperboreus]